MSQPATMHGIGYLLEPVSIAAYLPQQVSPELQCYVENFCTLLAAIAQLQSWSIGGCVLRRSPGKGCRRSVRGCLRGQPCWRT